MSISGMAKAALARRTTDPNARRTGQGSGSQESLADEGATSSSGTAVGDAMEIVATYVPTEIIAIYTAVVTALGPDRTFTTAWLAFWFFLCITPVTIWLVYAGKVRALDPNARLPIAVHQWPKFEMIAGIVIFFAWAYSMPGSPFVEFKDSYNPALAALVLPGCATFLGLLSPLMTKPLQA